MQQRRLPGSGWLPQRPLQFRAFLQQLMAPIPSPRTGCGWQSMPLRDAAKACHSSRLRVFWLIPAMTLGPGGWPGN